MWLNKIHGTFEIESINSLNNIADKTVEVLQQNKFITEKKGNGINFQRNIQFTMELGNRMQIFLFSYDGVIEIFKSDGNVQFNFLLNINAELFKLTLLIIIIGFFLFFFRANVNLVKYFGLSIVLILIQRKLIINHFINIVKH